MLQAIGSATTIPASLGSGGVGQRSELARLEKELSACINCATAKTREGQAKIDAVSQRISQVREKIGVAEQSQAARTQASPPAAAEPRGLAASDAGLYKPQGGSPFAGSPASVGQRIDTQA